MGVVNVAAPRAVTEATEAPEAPKFTIAVDRCAPATRSLSSPVRRSEARAPLLDR